MTSVESLSVHSLEEMAQIGRLVSRWIDDEVLASEGLLWRGECDGQLRVEEEEE